MTPMISTISGMVRHKDLHSLIVDVGGVGYKVSTTTDTALDAIPGESVFLWTHLAVKENALDLYGFLDRESLDLFELLITVSGIGPKTALSILNVATPEMLKQAVAEEDATYLTKVGGIGRKTVDKIVLELKDKLVTSSTDKHPDRRADGDVMEALLSLGYNERDIRDVLKKIKGAEGTASEKVRQALKLLSENAR